MKYIIECPYCSKSYVVETTPNKIFTCPNCGADNDFEHVTHQEDVDKKIQEAVDAALKKQAEQHKTEMVDAVRKAIAIHGNGPQKESPSPYATNAYDNTPPKEDTDDTTHERQVTNLLGFTFNESEKKALDFLVGVILFIILFIIKMSM